MNEQSAHEQLSAYLDDELSPQERAGVESLLEESASARQELAELRQVRELLLSLPADSLAETFPSEVLHACEQRMLLDDVRPASSDSSAKLKSKRFRVVWISGLVASLAFVGIMVTQWRPDSASMEMAMESDPATDRSLAEFDELVPISRNERPEWGSAEEEAEFADSVAMQDSISSPKTLNKTGDGGLSLESAPAEAMSGMAGASAPLPAAMKMMATESMPREVPVDALSLPGNQKLAFKDDLKNAQIGEVVRALQRRNEKVLVVELTVVDRRQGLEQLQLLLARHRIPMEQSVDGMARAEATTSPSQPSSTEVSNQLLAVHVEAPSQQLQAALAELRSAAAVAKIKQRPSISSTQLALASASDFDGYGLARKQSAAESSDKKSVGVTAKPMKSSPVPELATEEPANKGPTTRPDGIAKSEAATSEGAAVASLARQRKLTVGNEVLTAGNKSAGGFGGAVEASALPQEPFEPPIAADSAKKRPAKTAFNMRVQPSRRFLAKENGTKAVSPAARSVQLLFVLVAQDPQPPPPPLPDDAGAA